MTDLAEAVADVEAQPERIARLAAALYAADAQGVRQRDLVARTGYTRETIRRHIEDERIRRGEIPPTRRYLAAEKKRKATEERRRERLAPYVRNSPDAPTGAGES